MLPLDSSMFITLVFVPKMLNLRTLIRETVRFLRCADESHHKYVT